MYFIFRNPRRNNDVLLDFLPTLTEETGVPVLEDSENEEEVSSDSYEIVSIDNEEDANKECVSSLFPYLYCIFTIRICKIIDKLWHL